MDNEKPAAPPPVEALDAEGEGFEGQDAETLIAEALAPASAHMTPHLAADDARAIAPVCRGRGARASHRRQDCRQDRVGRRGRERRAARLA